MKNAFYTKLLHRLPVCFLHRFIFLKQSFGIDSPHSQPGFLIGFCPSSSTWVRQPWHSLISDCLFNVGCVICILWVGVHILSVFKTSSYSKFVFLISRLLCLGCLKSSCLPLIIYPLVCGGRHGNFKTPMHRKWDRRKKFFFKKKFFLTPF